jgi:hypothetical protein
LGDHLGNFVPGRGGDIYTYIHVVTWSFGLEFGSKTGKLEVYEITVEESWKREIWQNL